MSREAFFIDVLEMQNTNYVATEGILAMEVLSAVMLSWSYAALLPLPLSLAM